tara:strand:+ start:421 stop:648 length:228 start_codon:yes stop_codon:yes gene_type:complete
MMTKEQFADKLLGYIQSDFEDQFGDRILPNYVVYRTEFYMRKIKEYFDEFGDSYSPNARNIELDENKERLQGETK